MHNQRTNYHARELTRSEFPPFQPPSYIARLNQHGSDVRGGFKDGHGSTSGAGPRSQAPGLNSASPPAAHPASCLGEAAALRPVPDKPLGVGPYLAARAGAGDRGKHSYRAIG